MLRRLNQLLQSAPGSRGGHVSNLASTEPAPADVAAFAGVLAPVAQRVLRRPADQTRFTQSQAQYAISGVRDYEFATDASDAQPARVFDRLRWGGQLIFVSTQPREVQTLLDGYRNHPEWLIEHEPEPIVRPRFEKLPALGRLPLPASLRRLLLEEHATYFVARKVLIDPPTRLTAKHSYDVRLVRVHGTADPLDAADGFTVLKRVPTLEQAVDRLTQTCPDVPADRLHAIAQKLVHKVFTIFLTREAAFLKLLQRDLPPAFKARSPRVLNMQADSKGLVQSLSMTWLRQGGAPISQTAFAQQSAELLRALHNDVGIMHLDLRLDNLLVTDAGVCVIDFGSSVRVGEDLSTTPMVQTMIREMLQASQITRDLERQRRKNLIRAEIFSALPFPPTPAFDLFALATSMTRPHDNADFKGLIRHQRDSEEGQRFSRLRKRILQSTPGESSIQNLDDLCRELGVAPRATRPQATTPQTDPAVA